MRRFKIYTAGSMQDRADGRVIAQWRCDFERMLLAIAPEIECLHPEAVGCDHGGIDAEQTVAGDFEMIKNADLVAVLLSRRDLYGAHVEIGYAAALGILTIIAQVDADADRDDCVSVDHECKHTGHGCTCMSKQQYGEYWFVGATSKHSKDYSTKDRALAGLVEEVALVIDAWRRNAREVPT